MFAPGAAVSRHRLVTFRPHTEPSILPTDGAPASACQDDAMSSAAHPGPSADVSVRVGWADDAAAIGAVQVRAWRHEYAGLLPAEVLAGLDADAFAAAWASSLRAPKDARNRVLVALERSTVRGLAVTAPATDPDLDPVAVGEVSELTVDPGQTRRGHGSRLLQACADTLRADRFTAAVLWLNARDDVRRLFLGGAGWAPDGAHRELDLHGDGSVLVQQVRLHTDLTAAEDASGRPAAEEAHTPSASEEARTPSASDDPDGGR
jgi:ribosomal protein S18 acetylase RimI-like enzyme